MPRAATRRRALAAALACAAMLSACTGNSDDGTPAPASRRPLPSLRTPPQTTAAVGRGCSGDVVARRHGRRAQLPGSKAFVGAALQSANAYAKTLPGRTAAEKADAELATTGVKVLAISRGGDTPQQVLAQTTLKKTGAAVLVLLVGGQAGAPFKAAAVTPMLPDAKLDALDPTTDGSAAVARRRRA